MGGPQLSDLSGLGGLRGLRGDGSDAGVAVGQPRACSGDTAIAEREASRSSGRGGPPRESESHGCVRRWSFIFAASNSAWRVGNGQA